MRRRGAFAAILLAVAHAGVAYADSAPQISVFPPSIRVGGSGALEVQVTSPDKPSLRALAGSVSEPTRLGDAWIAKYLPREDAKAPGWDLLFAETGDGAVAVASIELVKRTKVPVSASKAVSELTVKVAGRQFGPFAGGADTVHVEVEIPPGAREIEVTASVPGLRPLVSTEPLALPPLTRVFLSGPSKAKRGRAFTVRAVVLDRKGRISRNPPRVEAQGDASIDAPVSAGPGVWNVRVVPRGGRVVLHVRGEGARARLAVAVPAAPRPTPTPSPSPTPAPVARPAIPDAPTCEELAVTPGEITTSTGLKARFEAALSERDPVRRRDRLVALHCLFPEEHSVRLQLTASWLLLGDHERTIELARPLIVDEEEIHDDHRALALSYLAAAELRTGDVDGAIRDARAAESLLPGLYSATYTLGEAYYVKKEFGRALAALLSAYRAAPGFATAVDHVILARLLDARGDRAEAAQHALAAARMEPNEESHWREAARLAESSGRWARAHEAWRILSASTLPGFTANTESHAAATRATVAAARDPEIIALEAALSAERANDLPRAVAILRALLERHRGNVAARWNLARLLHVLGNHDEAATEVFALLNAMPKWVPALILAGDVERGRGSRERALLFYTEAASVEPPAPMSPVARWRLSALAEADADGR